MVETKYISKPENMSNSTTETMTTRSLENSEAPMSPKRRKLISYAEDHIFSSTTLECKEFFDDTLLENLFYSGLLIDQYKGKGPNGIIGEYDLLLKLKARLNTDKIKATVYNKAGKAGYKTSDLSLGNLREPVIGALCSDEYVQIGLENPEATVLYLTVKVSARLPFFQGLYNNTEDFSSAAECWFCCTGQELRDGFGEIIMGTPPEVWEKGACGTEHRMYNYFDNEDQAFLGELERCRKEVFEQSDSSIIAAEVQNRLKGKIKKKNQKRRTSFDEEDGDSYRSNPLEQIVTTAVHVEETLDRIVECCHSALLQENNNGCMVILPRGRILIRKQDFSPQLLEKMNEQIFDTLGLEVSLGQIAFDTTIYDKVRHREKRPLPEKWDKKAFTSLHYYPDMKRYFETHVKKIETPTCFITISPPTIQRNDETPLTTCESKPESHINTYYKNAKTLVPTSRGIEEVNFIKHWLDDPDMQEFECTGFLPFPLGVVDPSPTTQFNKFLGFPIYDTNARSFDDSKLAWNIKNFNRIINGEHDLLQYRSHAYEMIRHAPKLLQPFFDILLCCVGDNLKSLDLLLAFVADIYQRPAYKPGVMPSITGSQGSGKSLAVRALGSAFGQYFMRTSDPENVWGKHATLCTEKLLVNLDETSVSDTADKQSQFKTIISEIETTVNPKFIAISETRQYTRFIATTNDPVPFSMDTLSGDRRHTIFKCNDRLKESEKMNWTLISEQYLPSEIFNATLSGFLVEFPLPVNWKKFRLETLTKYYHNVAKGNIPIFAQFVNYLEENRPRDPFIPNEELQAHFETFSVANGISTKVQNTTKLKKNLRLHYQNHYTDESRSIKGKTKRGIVLDIDGAVSLNRSKGWIG